MSEPLGIATAVAAGYTAIAVAADASLCYSLRYERRHRQKSRALDSTPSDKAKTSATVDCHRFTALCVPSCVATRRKPAIKDTTPVFPPGPKLRSLYP